MKQLLSISFFLLKKEKKKNLSKECCGGGEGERESKSYNIFEISVGCKQNLMLGKRKEKPG